VSRSNVIRAPAQLYSNRPRREQPLRVTDPAVRQHRGMSTPTLDERVKTAELEQSQTDEKAGSCIHDRGLPAEMVLGLAAVRRCAIAAGPRTTADPGSARASPDRLTQEAGDFVTDRQREFGGPGRGHSGQARNQRRHRQVRRSHPQRLAARGCGICVSLDGSVLAPSLSGRAEARTFACKTTSFCAIARNRRGLLE